MDIKNKFKRFEHLLLFLKVFKNILIHISSEQTYRSFVKTIKCFEKSVRVEYIHIENVPPNQNTWTIPSRADAVQHGAAMNIYKFFNWFISSQRVSNKIRILSLWDSCFQKKKIVVFCHCHYQKSLLSKPVEHVFENFIIDIIEKVVKLANKNNTFGGKSFFTISLKGLLPFYSY